MMQAIKEILAHSSFNKGRDFNGIYPMSENIGSGTIERLKLHNGIEVIITDVQFHTPVDAQFTKLPNVFEINYCIDGELSYENNTTKYQLVSEQANFFRLATNTAEPIMRANQSVKLIEIRFTLDYIAAHFSDERESAALALKLEQRRSNIHALTKSTMLRTLMHEIFYYPYSEPLIKELFIEGKVLGIFALSFNELLNEKNEKLPSKEDMEKIELAYDIVLENVKAPYSIKELANKVQLNEYKLKTIFKQMYGMTIFELIRTKKMARAMELLTHSDKNITEIATQLGYANMSNFALAFRKQYGMNPKEYLQILAAKK